MTTEKEKDQSGDGVVAANAGGGAADEIEYVEEEETSQEVANRILKFPNVLAALQTQRIAEMLAALPPTVKRRIKALKKMQLETQHIEAKFFKEVHELECKYHKMYLPFYEKRDKIVSGAYEPNDDEAQWPSDDEEEAELSKELKEKANLENKQKALPPPPVDDNVKGIPDFWLTIFKNCNILSEMVQPHDEPILKHLTDIKAICETDPMSFQLDFYFSPNEFFTNEVLTKQYLMKCSPDEDDPFNFEGPEIYKCTGCVVNWNKGKNITLKVVKKKQKHKSRGVVRTVTKTVPNDSFFNFFTPPIIADETKEEDVDEDLRSILTSDFEIGHYIRERIIPKAVLYFTGEGIDDEEDYDDEEEEEDSSEEDEEAEGGDSDNQKNAKKNPDCKQQ